jgi:carbonyl reductase 1
MAATAAAAGPILVTGANRGIGLAVARSLLSRPKTVVSRVLVGARRLADAEAACTTLAGEKPSGNDQEEARDRLFPFQIDVASDDSVASAAETLKQFKPLQAIVNNAGMLDTDFETVWNVNVTGQKRVVDAMLPLLDPKHGRIVNVSSGSGPMFVEKCDPELQEMMKNPQSQKDVDALYGMVKEALSDSPDDERAKGIKAGGEQTVYGSSKAALTMYTFVLAKEHPNLKINAISPGFIATRMTAGFAPAGKTVEEIGGKSPEEAIRPFDVCLFETEATGWYFGSDGLRSPPHMYRSPGSAEYKP